MRSYTILGVMVRVHLGGIMEEVLGVMVLGCLIEGPRRCLVREPEVLRLLPMKMKTISSANSLQNKEICFSLYFCFCLFFYSFFVFLFFCFLVSYVGVFKKLLWSHGCITSAAKDSWGPLLFIYFLLLKPTSIKQKKQPNSLSSKHHKLQLGGRSSYSIIHC